MHTASICTIGDEILIGQINDTNSGEIARALNKIGIRVVYMVSLRDDEKEIESGLSHCMDLSDIVIVTGGLGPTSDDKTKKVVADMFSMPLTAYHPGQLEVINNICRKRGVELSDLNRDQALVPLGCKVLINREGTAPGMIFEKKSAPDSPPVSIVCLLPGVPYEMRALLEQLTEYIRICYPIRDIIHKTILTYGIAESRLSEILSDWEKTLNPSLHLAYLPAPSSGVKLRISGYGEERDTAINIVSEAVNQLKEILQ
ncbi:MAG: molybdopterin-binding protein, partial [Bacteroidales bacterium]|nr:molybdopterin-binding protein [Bacteroidales bacterium]